MYIANRHLKRAFGFTYIGLMLIVAIAGIALSGVGIVWKTEMQRENEKELRFVGQQYVAAIASYYECKVCGPHQLPKNLKDLLKDSRSPSVVRHIRKLYRDPMTRSNDWGLIKNGDRIMGVYSKSKEEPLAKPKTLDTLNKKNDSTKSGTATNVNQANLNQLSSNQISANQTAVGSANTNLIGINPADLNKSDTNKLDKPIKPKKPSYQDWQFVYGGGGEASVSAITVVEKNSSESSLNKNQNNSTTQESVPDDWQAKRGERIAQICDASYQEDLMRCEQLLRDGQDSGSPAQSEFKQCQSEAKDKYNACRKSVN